MESPHFNRVKPLDGFRWADGPPRTPTMKYRNNQIIIGFYSKHPRSGKSYLAEQLASYTGMTKLSYAAPIKIMARTFFNLLGYTPQEISVLEECRKDVPVLYGKSMRDFWKFIGNEFGKEFLGSSIWCDYMAAQIGKERSRGCDGIIIDDVRFHSEFSQIKFYGGVVVKVIGENEDLDLPVEEEHRSEGLLENYPFDLIIDNRNKDENVVESLIDQLRRSFFEDI